MKKIISILLLLAMCLSLFAGCQKDDKKSDDGSDETTAPTQANGDEQPADPEEQLAKAIAYLEKQLANKYPDTPKGEPYEVATDVEMLSQVIIAGVSYPVTWTVKVTQGSSESATVAEDGKTILVKMSPEDITLFTATATVSDGKGNTATTDILFKVPSGYTGTDQASMEEIVKLAYALEENTQLDKPATLAGKIIRIKSPYDEGYQNITVIIQVGDLTEMPIECYRLKGDGAETLNIGDTVTVTGTLKNYNGTIEFDAGCVLQAIEKGEVTEAPTDPKEIIDAAYGLADGNSLTYTATLTGKITKINTPYNPSFGNLTVTIAVEGQEDKPIQCYRLKGDGAETLKAGDTVTVTGYLVNYKGTVQFDQGCTLDKVVPGDGDVPVAPADPKQIVKEAYALAEGESLPYMATLTGKITEISDPYSDQFKNITVVMKVEGKEITCYRLAGTGAESLMVNDTITVTGYIKNHYGTIEFDFGCSLDKVVKGEGNPETIVKPSTPGGIVDAAYALGKDETLPYEATLTGKIVSVDDAYSAEYNNITVTIAVSGKESKPIKCYHLKGEGVDKLAVGDTITVTGKIKNYNGTVEFDAPSLDAVTSGGGKPVEVLTDPKKIVDAAYALADGEELSYDVTLTGKVTSIKTAYDPSYQNISVVIAVDGKADKPILCYRMKGTGADKLAVGDTITVTGRLKNYGGTIEFDTGCSLDKRVSGGVTVPTDPKEIVNAAYALEPGKALPYSCQLTGKITSIDTAYSEQYKNITVTIVVEGCEDKPILCYRLKGDGAADLKVGDTITVSGVIKNYVKDDSSTIEFDSGCVLV